MNNSLRLMLLTAAVAVASSHAAAEEKQPAPPKPKVQVQQPDLENEEKLLNFEVQDATANLNKRDRNSINTALRSSSKSRH